MFQKSKMRYLSGKCVGTATDCIKIRIYIQQNVKNLFWIIALNKCTKMHTHVTQFDDKYKHINKFNKYMELKHVHARTINHVDYITFDGMDIKLYCYTKSKPK